MFEDQDDLLPEEPEEDDLPDVEEPDEVPTDEAEEVTSQEAAESDIPPQEEEPHLTVLVCEMCQKLNLTESTTCITCLGCGKIFCYHFTSSVDVSYCVNCLSDVSVTKRNITKAYYHTNQETGQTTFYRRRAREIQIGGLSWLFAQRKIKELSDEELDLAIEYHRNIFSLMIAEAEKRKNDKMHRYANVKVNARSAATKVTSSSTTTVKKTKTISKNKAAEQAAAVLNAMLAGGASIDDLLKKITK